MRVLVVIAGVLAIMFWAFQTGTAPRIQGNAQDATTRAQRAICPSPVMAADRTISCDGAAVTTVRRPDGRVDVITISPPTAARR